LYVAEHDINVHDVRGVACATTGFGLPPVFENKQLILVNGRAQRFTTDEVVRLGGDSAGLSICGSTLAGMIVQCSGTLENL
jgi:hypothetical protein